MSQDLEEKGGAESGGNRASGTDRKTSELPTEGRGLNRPDRYGIRIAFGEGENVYPVFRVVFFGFLIRLRGAFRECKSMRLLLRQMRCHFFIVLALSSVLCQGIMVDPLAARPSKEADTGGPDGERTVGSPLERDGKKYTVEQFSIEYDTPDDRLPAVSQLEKIPVELGHTRQGLVAPREEIPVVRGTVGTITDVSHEFYASAIRHICMDDDAVCGSSDLR